MGRAASYGEGIVYGLLLSAIYVRDKGNWWAETHRNGGRSAICKYLPRDFPGQITPDLPRIFFLQKKTGGAGA
jgi:hypothetical protein